MAKKINKKPKEIRTPEVHRRNIEETEYLKFSFKYYMETEKFKWPPSTHRNYPQKLFDRLQCISDLTFNEFRVKNQPSLRSHPIAWKDTSEPEGFIHLPEQLRGVEAWQFQLSSNKHGRVHGFFIDETFYIVWLDPHHSLYPSK